MRTPLSGRLALASVAVLFAACSSAKPTGAPSPAPAQSGKPSVLPEFVVPSAGNSPFSGVVRVGNLLFVAGQIGVDSAKAGVAGETASALIHIRDLLRQSGSSLDRVAKCTVMLADMKDWAAMNEAYIKFFAPNKRPARSSFGTTGLALGARLEIECIATVD
jgi:enamine deaminase RidA (YjgF/YER057c/UK114 family)